MGSSTSIAVITGDRIDSVEGGILDQSSSSIEDNDDDIRVVGPPLPANQEIDSSEGQAPHDEVVHCVALTGSVTFDLPTLKKATEQELQEYVFILFYPPTPTLACF